MPRRKHRVPGPPSPVHPPHGLEGQAASIIFGSNVEARMCLMQFSMTCDRLLFTPEQARDVAKQLLLRADMAEGKKGM